MITDAISILFKSVNEAFDIECQVKCSDGFVRNISPMVAAWLGDREEHQVIASVVAVRHT
jgi:hypothetical protein